MINRGEIVRRRRTANKFAATQADLLQLSKFFQISVQPVDHGLVGENRFRSLSAALAEFAPSVRVIKERAYRLRQIPSRIASGIGQKTGLVIGDNFCRAGGAKAGDGASAGHRLHRG